ncbi:MAG: saccharopine dehydrogenase NADP-binding domain-containing protein [Alphaproteobacteria bacterium]|nr:saccharopine dehydrogenase NADP-binding domain-containing protein [Alphaproteobacteria bacterium]
MPDQPFDVTVFGATSFVGQILTRYMAETYGHGGDVRWAIAGRSEAKLNELKESLGPTVVGLPVIVADAADEEALTGMVKGTRVVISTVGPYALYGSLLVKLCATLGTDYVDLTGEPQWIRRMIDAHEEDALRSGARIVHCCGFDSIPSDLGVHFLEAEAMKRFGAPCTTVKMGVKAMKGGASGGTVASMMNAMKEMGENPDLKREMKNPFSLCPREHGFKARQRNVQGAVFDKDFGRWLAPFVMAAINTRVVHRSNALRDKAYGKEFRYDESVFTKGRWSATGMTLGLGGFMVLAAMGPTRGLLERFVVPKPGEGPSPEAQEKGFYDLRFYGETDKGDILRAKVTGDRDPGYGSTSKMLAQAGLALAGLAKADLAGGFWTPATAMGDPLIDRLQKHAGLTFEIVED